MFIKNFGIPELLLIWIIVLFIGIVTAAMWLTRKSRQSTSSQISTSSAILIAVGFIWCWLITAWMSQSPLFSSYTLGGVFVLSVIPMVLALCVYRFGKRKKDWNVSARWFFWSEFALALLLNATNKR